MADPFEQLRLDPTPVDPDPAFAARLRRRLAAALAGRPDVPPTPAAPVGDRSLRPPAPGAAMPEPPTLDELDLGARPAVAPAGDEVGTGRPPAAVLTPYLAVAGASAAIDFYTAAFGARLRDAPVVMPDGRIGHAELDLAGDALMLADEHPEGGVAAPAPGQGAAVTLHLEVADVDGTVDRAAGAGATVERVAADYEYGRNAVLRDPFGHRWLVSGPVTAGRPDPASPAAGVAPSMAAAPRPAPGATVRAAGDGEPGDGDGGQGEAGQEVGIRHGDLGYVSLWVPDAERAAAFFAAVLGWRYRSEAAGHARQVDGQSLHHGLWSVAGAPTLFCCYAVADVEAALDRVRAAGGSAEAPQAEPYGLVAGCTDDQGVRFAVFTPPGGLEAGGGEGATAPGDGAAGGEGGGRAPGRQGDVAYVTMEVVDSARARAFYGSVLGWRFSPGHVPDGWQVTDVEPMVGLSGGHARATTVPMYRVDDVQRAVAAARRAGGTATDPQVQPYGITADCRDDQGTRFYLGQL